MRVIIAIFLVIIAAVFFRIISWQLEGEEQTSDEGRTVSATDLSRGRIMDRNGLLLATDNFLWELYANPREVRNARESSRLIAQVAEILNQPISTVQDNLTADVTVFTLAKGLSDEQRQRIKDLKQPGLFWAAPVRVRAYPQGSLAAHLIGHVNRDQDGLYGVEASYQPWLRRSETWPGRLPGEPQPILDAWKLYLPSPAGRDLALNLDAPLQHLVEQRLIEALTNYEAEAGTIIVMDPRTGALLALANYPNYDLNRPLEVDAETWVNAAVNQIYEPGSVFKLITFAAALETGQITPDKLYQDDGVLYVAGQRIRNAGKEGLWCGHGLRCVGAFAQRCHSAHLPGHGPGNLLSLRAAVRVRQAGRG